MAHTDNQGPLERSWPKFFMSAQSNSMRNTFSNRNGVTRKRLLDIPELLSAYMRYVKAKHESIDSKLLPGYKGHVIARLLDIPELVSAYMRYVKAKHIRNVTGLLPGYKGHVIARLLDIPELLSAYKRYVKAKHGPIEC
ncbi:hypothetical protein E3N88_08913 [Mikania micrantha]|uniref:Uncharacterized protein n=1 Tax=Mikania micrantha TaxID=192012 RepID=A0A5N6PIJ4_9ASTR|nr:hypothetical protein E3N88_08913 [Mikania micrantha]